MCCTVQCKILYTCDEYVRKSEWNWRVDSVGSCGGFDRAPSRAAGERERDRHNSARHEYCLVKRLVAIGEAIRRSKQRRVATGIFVIIIIIIAEIASVIWRFSRPRVFCRLWINEGRANSALAKRAWVMPSRTNYAEKLGESVKICATIITNSSPNAQGITDEELRSREQSRACYDR